MAIPSGSIPKGVTNFVLALFVLLGATTTVVGVSDEERTISMYNIHTKETLNVVYKRNGKFVPEAMKKVNHIMRDWRRNEPTKMDPKLVDLMWGLHAQLGSQKPIHLISGYRSRKTNEKLRRRGGGQARNSRHIMGKAADIHFPDVSAKQIRNSALVREIGGVGYYPTSAIPFVHVDTQGVRHWPRLPRLELAALFPDGKSRHRPRRGGPITKKDYKRAMARLNAKQKRLVRIARGEIRPKRPGVQAPIQVARLPEPKPLIQVPVQSQPVSPPPTPTWTTQLVAARVTTAPRAQVEQAALSPLPLTPQQAKQPIEQNAVYEPQRSDARFITASADPVGDLIVRTAAAWMAGDHPKVEIKAKARIPQAVRNAINAKPLLAPTPAIAKHAPQPKPEPDQIALAIDRSVVGLPEPEGWARAPKFDEDHADELAYLPFPILPLMGDRVDGKDGYFGTMVPPKYTQVLAMMEEKDLFPMRFRQGLHFAQMLWAREFKGLAVASLDDEQ